MTAVVAVTVSHSASLPPKTGFAFKKGKPDMARAATRERCSDQRIPGRPTTRRKSKKYLKRAYPADDVPWEATAARSGWASLSKKAHSVGTWQLIGPSEANVPGVLNALGDAAPYITAGRVTAMVLAPKCGAEADDDRDNRGHDDRDGRGNGDWDHQGDDDHDRGGTCRLYVAAAGGGIWRTDKPMHTNPSQKWEYISDSFGTNAIGALVIDPNDPTGNTLYAGTGEPNVSTDSEAGVGIYKSTDGGDTWTNLADGDRANDAGNGTYTGDAFAGRSIARS